MTMKNNTIIALFGPKPNELCGYKKEFYNTFVKQLKELLMPIVKSHKNVTFVTDGTQGFAQLAFWAVNTLKKQFENDPDITIQNCIHTAYPNISKYWVYDGLFGSHNFKKMNKVADQTFCYAETTPTDKSGIKDCVNELYAYITDKCDICVCATNNDYWTLPNQGSVENALRIASYKKKNLIRIEYNTNPVLTIKSTTNYNI